MKLKSYDVYHSGGTLYSSLLDTCITKAIKQFIQNNNLVATYELYSTQEGSIRLKGNYGICSDYVISERR